MCSSRVKFSTFYDDLECLVDERRDREGMTMVPRSRPVARTEAWGVHATYLSSVWGQHVRTDRPSAHTYISLRAEVQIVHAMHVFAEGVVVYSGLRERAPLG